MISYSLLYGIGDTTRIFKVERETVKTWIYHFKEFLSEHVNPPKPTARKFTLSDIRVLAYVSFYWEEEPDIVCIKVGLNANEHYENESIQNELDKITPMFYELPENADESWTHGALYTGVNEKTDLFVIANSYKLAGDIVADSAIEEKHCWELYCPAVYNYRHATELYLKDVTGKRDTHNLLALLDSFREYHKKQAKQALPEWFENIIQVFHDFDEYGTSFRYGDNKYRETFIDFVQLKKKMNWLAKSFNNIQSYKLHRRGSS